MFKLQTIGEKQYRDILIQVAVLPFKDVRITQRAFKNTYSHNGYHAIDNGGKYPSGKRFEPAYAPFDMRCIWYRKVPGSMTYITLYESLRPVQCADGNEVIVSILFAHGGGQLDYVSEGTVIKQGEQCYQEGTDGTAAEHIHIDVKQGRLNHDSYEANLTYIYQPELNQTVVALKDDCPITDIFYLYKLFNIVHDTKGLEFKTFNQEDYNGWYHSPYYHTWYYANSKIGIARSWTLIDKTWYFFNPNNDIMQANQWIAGKDGWYYMKNDGAMAKNETLTINGKPYSFNTSGICLNP